MDIIILVLVLALLVFMAMRGFNILLTTLVCSLLLAITSGLNMYETLLDTFMTGYVGFFKSYFIMFLAGALFGKLMEDSYGADAIAALVVEKLGTSKTILAIVSACFILAYGGVSVFVVGFTVYPIALNLFKEANFPREYLPATIAFGSVTFAMTSPGTPQIQNIIPSNALGTTTMAGTVVGIIAGIFMFVVGMIWLSKMIEDSVKNGQQFTASEKDTPVIEGKKLPSAYLSFIPLIATIILLNLFKLPVEVSILCGIIIGIVIFVVQKTLAVENLTKMFTQGSASAISAITNTCAVVGFGSVVKSLPAFDNIINMVTNIPGVPLIGAALAVTIICAITGSASGGLGIALPIVGPVYVEMGVIPAALHRVSSIASGALDSMPHNGYVVTLLNICDVNHRDGYKPIFKLTVILPVLATILAIILFELFPMWP